MTLVVEHDTNKEPLEIFSMQFLPRKKKFYKKDLEGRHYIPETL